MNEWLQNMGLLSIVWVLLYTIKKGYGYYDLTRPDEYEDAEITRQAEEFADSLPARKS